MLRECASGPGSQNHQYVSEMRPGSPETIKLMNWHRRMSESSTGSSSQSSASSSPYFLGQYAEKAHAALHLGAIAGKANSKAGKDEDWQVDLVQHR